MIRDPRGDMTMAKQLLHATIVNHPRRQVSGTTIQCSMMTVRPEVRLQNIDGAILKQRQKAIRIPPILPKVQAFLHHTRCNPVCRPDFGKFIIAMKINKWKRDGQCDPLMKPFQLNSFHRKTIGVRNPGWNWWKKPPFHWQNNNWTANEDCAKAANAARGYGGRALPCEHKWIKAKNKMQTESMIFFVVFEKKQKHVIHHSHGSHSVSAFTQDAQN